VSSREVGLCAGPPATPSKYTAAAFVEVVVVGVAVADVVVVVVACVLVVLLLDSGVTFVTVVVVVPHDASAGTTARASSRPRRITRDDMPRTGRERRGE
jgi:hypothetical protein